MIDLTQKVMSLMHERGQEVSKSDVIQAVDDILATDESETTQLDVLEYLVAYLEASPDDLKRMRELMYDSYNSQQPGYSDF
jgi:hypothetical protein